MAQKILFAEGFERFDTDAQLQARWIDYYNASEVSSVTPFGVGQSLYSPASQATDDWGPVFYAVDPSIAYYGMACRVKLALPATSVIWLFSINRVGPVSGSPSIYLNWAVTYNTATKSLYILGPGSVVHAGPTVVDLIDGAWHSIEAVGHSSNSGAVKLYVDGTLIFDVSSVDTYSATTLGVFFMGDGDNLYLDDVIVYDADGAVTAMFGTAPDWQVVSLDIESDAGTNEFTTSSGVDHYAMVDENVSDDGTTYLESTGTGDTELFELADLPAFVASVKAIHVDVTGAVASAGIAETLTPIMYSGTTEDDLNSGITFSDTTYSTVDLGLFDVDPDTAVAWTLSGVNALQIGFKT